MKQERHLIGIFCRAVQYKAFGHLGLYTALISDYSQKRKELSGGCNASDISHLHCRFCRACIGVRWLTICDAFGQIFAILSAVECDRVMWPWFLAQKRKRFIIGVVFIRQGKWFHCCSSKIYIETLDKYVAVKHI